MAEDKARQRKEWKRDRNGILDCGDYAGQDKTKCLALKVKEQTVKDTKKAMGMRDKPKAKPKEEKNEEE
jgi:hypothetical protein